MGEQRGLLLEPWVPQIERGELGRAWPAPLTELHIMFMLQASPCYFLRSSTGHMDEGYQAIGFQHAHILLREKAAIFKGSFKQVNDWR